MSDDTEHQTTFGEPIHAPVGGVRLRAAVVSGPCSFYRTRHMAQKTTPSPKKVRRVECYKIRDMSGYTPIAAGLSAVKTGFDLVKGVRDLLKQDKVDHKEISNRLMEIQQLLLDAQAELNKAGHYTDQLEEELFEMKRRWEIGKQFEFKNGVYWYQGFPYCPNCWEVDQKPNRLHQRFHGSGSYWTCEVHKQGLLHNTRIE